MKTVTKLIAGAAAALSISAASAQAMIFISFDGVNSVFSFDETVDPLATTFNFAADCSVLNCGGFESVTVRGDGPSTRPGILHTDSVEVNARQTGSAALTIYVTRTDLLPLGSTQFQSYTTNNVGGAINNQLSTLVSNSNQKFGGTQIGSWGNNTNGSSSSDQTTHFAFNGPGVYSVTHKYVLSAPSATGQRSASPTIGLSVPEPATWALMIMGFGGAGAMLRRRRQAVAA